MPGAEIRPDGKVRFRVGAPAAQSLALTIEGSEQTILFLSRLGSWHELVTAEAKAGTHGRLQLPDGTCVPDPASRFQPLEEIPDLMHRPILETKPPILESFSCVCVGPLEP
jgi:1,4-alpha-glucan branching enzyme